MKKTGDRGQGTGVRGQVAGLIIFLISLLSPVPCPLIYAQEAGNYESLKEEYNKLKKDYDMVVLDRDNILTQSRNLLQYKSKVKEAEDAASAALREKEQVSSRLEERITQNQLLQDRLTELQSQYDNLVLDRDNLKNYIEKMEIEYRIVKETKNKIQELTKENTNILLRFKSYETKINSLEKSRLDALAEVEIYRKQTRETDKRYNEALAKNQALEKRTAEIPKRFAEIARENKILIKQTALMHYNLGVFYTQNKEYSRSIAEFEKCIELNPDDAYAHFNLGYIYAEYLVDRPKAIEQFRQFLRLAKSDDKDVDWVKKFIITWQTWEGKKPAQ